MGVTVAFSGRQTEPALRDEALAWARSFAADMEWGAIPIEVERPRGFLGSQVLEVPRVSGLLLSPHLACEPLPLLFLETTGHLVDSILFDEGEGDIRLESEVLVKTQFAGPAVHAELCEFLFGLKDRFVPNLEIDDETGFAATKDGERLVNEMDACWEAILDEIDEMREPGAALVIGGIPLRVPAEDRPSGEYAQVTEEHQELLTGLEEWLATAYGGFGLDFDHTPAGIINLDLLMIESDKEGWCDSLEDEEAERFAHALGATYGRAVAAILGGQWEFDDEEGLTLSEVGGVGLQMNPFQAAADRIARGPSHAFEHHITVYQNLAQRLNTRMRE